MKLLGWVCFLLVLIPRSSAQELKDLRQVHITVETINKEEQKSIGLSEEAVESQTLVALKRDMPKLDVNKTAPSSVYVNINTIELTNALVVDLSIKLRRPARVLRDDSSEIGTTFATVWGRSVLLTGGQQDMASRIREEISEMITELAAAYYGENPR
jgi:hypothetical protein